MNTEVITQTEGDIAPVEMQYTLETLPKLLPQQALMLNYILEGYNYTQAYLKAGYDCDSSPNTAAFILVHRNPIKAHLDYFMHHMAKRITPEYIKNKLNHIAEKCMEDSTKHGETAIKAIDVINKMQGNYAQTNTTNIQINTSIEDIRNAKQQYVKDK